jgi:simple sugar transport system substrate-binding protein
MDNKRSSSRLSRRDALRLGALGSAGLATASLLGACGKSAGTTGSGSRSKTIAWETGYLSFFFFVVLQEAVKRTAAAKGLQFVGKNANGDSAAQVADWNSLLLQKPRYLISDALDSEALVPLTKTAKRLGVPIGMVDTPVSAGDVAVTVTFDNRQAGVMAGEKTVELLKAKHGTPKGTVLNNYGSLTASALRLRREGFESVVKKYPDIKLLSRPQNNDHATALSVVNATLREYPALDAIHMPTDIFVVDARNAMKTQNRLFPVGHADHIILTSIDASPNALQWVKAGEIDADIAQDPIAYVEICIEMLEKYTLKGQPVPLGPYSNDKYFWEKAEIVRSPSGPLLNIPPYFLTKENADDKRHWANICVKDWGLPEGQS